MRPESDWEPFYNAVLDDTTHEVDRLLDAFGASLEDWLSDVLNYPIGDNWWDNLNLFASLWAEYGVEIEAESLDKLESLIRTRSDGSGPFAWEKTERRPPIPAAQLGPGIFSVPDSPPPKKGKTAPTEKAGKAQKPDVVAPKPDRKRLPKTGEWIEGKPGNGILKLDELIKLSTGEVVEKVPYRDGMPVFDKWQLKDGDVVIAITGERAFDRSEAEKMWVSKHKGTELAEEFVFHHDGQVTELVTHDGKKVFVGRMQAIPEALNAKLPHIGSASVAKRYTLDSKLAAEVNKLAREGKGPLKAVEKRFRKLIAKQTKRASRLLPIIGGAVAVIDFADNVEAHGVGGAVLRTVPLLGDIVTAYDVGSEIAESIEEQSKEALKEAYNDANEPVRQAHRAARQDTVDAFNKIAATLKVTKQFYTTDEIIDDIKEPIAEFYTTMYLIHFRETHGHPIDYPPNTTPAQAADEGPLDMRRRIAIEKLERDLRRKLQLAPSGPQQLY